MNCRFLSDIPLGMLSGAASPLPCENIPGLLKSQRHACMEQPEVMVTIGEGVRTGIEECQNQFRDQRWNCTTIQKEDEAGTSKLALKGPSCRQTMHHIGSHNDSYSMSILKF